GQLLEIVGLYDAFRAGKASAEGIGALMDAFAARLVSWNIDGDDDKPLPADMDGVRSLDADLFMDLCTGWVEGMTQAPPPLPKPSANGAPEASLPMEALPASPSS